MTFCCSEKGVINSESTEKVWNSLTAREKQPYIQRARHAMSDTALCNKPCISHSLRPVCSQSQRVTCTTDRQTISPTEQVARCVSVKTRKRSKTGSTGTSLSIFFSFDVLHGVSDYWITWGISLEWVQKPYRRRKTPLVVGGTRTQVLADSMTIAASALNHCVT